MDERTKWGAKWDVRKYSALDYETLTEKLGRRPEGDDFVAAKIMPMQTVYIPGNLLTAVGQDWLYGRMLGGTGAPQPMSNGATRIGAGDGSAVDIADTDLSALSGSSHRWFQIMDSTYPKVVASPITGIQEINLQATFGTANANFNWNEFGIDIDTPTVTSGNTISPTVGLVNHKLLDSTVGTKLGSQAWVVTVVLTVY